MRLLVKRDLDGFFGLFIDNLVQLLLMVSLCGSPLCGMTGDDARFLTHHILPGAAVSILIGNLFYAWQAHRLAKRTGRDDVTALPYGINTPSLLVYVFFVMAPVYAKTKSAEAAWQMGLFACLGSGLIELGGAFVAERIRRHTPRAALLSTLSGIAVGFISMTFALQVFQKPLVAMLPLAIILITYFSRMPFPLGLPGGFVAIVLGSLLGWLLPESWSGVTLSVADVADEWSRRGLYLPQFAGSALMSVFNLPLSDWMGYLSVIVPMGLFNVMGSLQNIESAEAAGDRFHTGSSLAVNGLGTIAAACFGSCFPTTIYIGHPGWKGLGARAGYSTLNGLAVTLICLTGTVTLIQSLVPIEAGIAIVLWIGVIITAQAFQATPPEHAPAVAIGLFPSIAAWGATIVQGAFRVAGGATMQDALTRVEPPNFNGLATEVNGFLMHAMIVLERGYIFTCMILAAIAALLIDRKFFGAGVFSLVGAACAGLGLTHAYRLTGNTIDFLFSMGQLTGGDAASGASLDYHAWPVAAGYVLFAAVFFAFGEFARRHPEAELPGHG